MITNEKISKNGNQYFTGRWGSAKVLLLKGRDVAEDGGATWDLLLSQAAPYEKKERAPATSHRGDDYDGPDVTNEGPAPRGLDDEIPFLREWDQPTSHCKATSL